MAINLENAREARRKFWGMGGDLYPHHRGGETLGVGKGSDAGGGGIQVWIATKLEVL